MSISNKRVDLSVQYRDKDKAKRLGARWDGKKRTWFVPAGLELERFKRWLPEDLVLDFQDNEQKLTTNDNKYIGLSDLLFKLKQTIEYTHGTPQWIRVDIVKVNDKGSNVYLGIEERDSSGNVLAAATGMIWGSKRALIFDKFRNGTGENIRSDISVLVFAYPEFHERFGLKLVIEDIDPTYTIGKLEAKKKAIRKSLQDKGIFKQNHKHTMPSVYTNVAVIAPKDSASLADFERESNFLTKHNLCSFTKYYAVFEGVKTSESLCSAIKLALKDSLNKSFDALVIIRGGGSKVGLSWLDDLPIAMMVCNSTIPVFVGVGHQIDTGILDEVAKLSFDTPSKVSAHIFNAIVNNALNAKSNHNYILSIIAALLKNTQESMKTRRAFIEQIPQSLVRYASSLSSQHHQSLWFNATTVLERAKMSLGLLNEAMETSNRIQINLSRLTDVHLRNCQMESQRQILLAVASIKDKKNTIHYYMSMALQHADNSLSHNLFSNINSTRSILALAKSNSELLFRKVLGLDPKNVLNHGYAIVRNNKNEPVGSAAKARQEKTFKIQFYDGVMPVINPEPDFTKRKK